MKSFIFGTTMQGLPIPAYHFGSSGPRVLVIGGVHGDEAESVVASYGLLHRFAKGYSYRLTLDLVPMYNLDGVINKQRTNSNGTDLNRNLPTNDWSAEVTEDRYHPGEKANSESETQALVTYIEKHKPSFVMSLHAQEPMINISGQCEKIAETMAKYTNYEIKDHLNYPTPGCLGTYCGIERGIPVLAYQLEAGLESSIVLKNHVKAMLEGLKAAEENIC